MLGFTHLLAGVAIGASSGDLLSVLVAIFGALFPDIDDGKSLLGRWFPFGWLQHRGFLHTLFAAGLFSVLFSLVLRMMYADISLSFVFFLGYLSHLVLDGVTKKGILFFYPSKLRCHGSFQTGGLFERFFQIFLVAIILFLFLNRV